MSIDIKKAILNILILPVIFLSVIVVCSSCGTTTTTDEGISSGIPADPYNYCPISQQEFNSWFQNNVVTKDGFVKSADSLNFPTNNTNCDFYKWSVQMFLWILSPSGTTRVFDSETFYDVSPADADRKRTLIPHTPGVFRNFSPVVRQRGPQRLPVTTHPKTGKLLEIDSPVLSKNGKQLVKNNKGEEIEIEKIQRQDNTIVFYDKDGNKIVGATPVFNKDLNTENLIQQFKVNEKVVYVDALGAVVDETEQGQATGNVLMAQNGSLVYYTILVNDVYAVFKKLNPGSNRFPDDPATLDNIVTCGKTLGINIMDGNALAIELKMSWVKVDGLANADDYVQTTAKIPTYFKKTARIWIKSGEEEARLALVGMHVVGNVAGHPEMLWSTFEHQDNTPMNTFSYINTSSQMKTVPSNTIGNWTFSKSGSTGPFNRSRMKIGAETLMMATAGSIGPSDTLRVNPWGVIEDTTPNQNVQNAAQSNSQIISINNNFRGMLIDGDVRKNYILIGNTWTNQGAFPTGGYPKGGNEIGTSNLANSTMETDYQPSNCFDCHRSNDSYTGLSHIWSDIIPLAGTCNTDQTKNRDLISYLSR